MREINSNIKKLTKEHIEEILPLRINLQRYDLRWENKIDFDMPIEELINATRKYLNEHLEKDLYLFGYFKDNKLVSISGFILENHFPTNYNLSGLTAYITTVYTIEMYRGRGYQKELLSYVLDYAKKMKIVRFKLDSCNEIAIKMYNELGFKKSNTDYKLKL